MRLIRAIGVSAWEGVAFIAAFTQRVNCMLRHVYLQSGQLNLNGQDEGGCIRVPMEVGAAAAATRSSVAWDSRQQAVHARSPLIRRGDLGGVGVVGVRSRTGVSDED
eukprot:1731534-Pleurochrysis_carterae.AAC.1